MADAVLERPRGTKPPTAGGWWGKGPSPAERWPGSTIDLPAVWHRGRRRWESPGGAYYFDQEAADRAASFFPTYLRHHIGEFAGQAFRLMPYQELLLTRPIFGWKRASDGQRRFRKVFAFLPKGAGKSPWGAGTGLYLAFCDHEPGAEVYAVAGDKKQARTVHDNARIMVEIMTKTEPEFEGMFEVLRDEIRCPETNSTYQVISADASTKHGFRPHGVIFDEFHAQPNRDLYEALKKSMVKRRQPMMVIITHAGDDDEGICYEEYEYAKRVLSGSVADDTCLPVIFEIEKDEDWTLPATWRRVNPGHGITVKTDGVAGECAEAKAEPRKRNDFVRFHCNKWVNQATAWIPVEWWDACPDKPLDDEMLRGLQCAAGFDLAQKWDLAAFVIAFRHRIETPQALEVIADDAAGVPTKRILQLNYRISLVPFFWIPDETMREHEKLDGIPYRLWADQGLIIPTDGPTIDYTRIYTDIVQKVLPRFPMLKQGLIGYDPAFATDIATDLRDRAGFGDKVREVLGNYTHLSEPSYIFEAHVRGKLVSHGGHRVLRAHVENVAIKRDDAGRIRPIRPKKAGKRVDGVLASIMAEKMLALLPPQQRRIGAMIV